MNCERILGLMGTGGMKYMVRSADGSEYGPVDQEALIQWAQSGRITSDSEVRNALMQKWGQAAKVPFLEDIIEAQSHGKKEGSGAGKLADLIKPTSGNQSKGGAFKFTPATVGLRAAAWVIDAIILGLVGFGLLVVTSSFIQNGMPEKQAFILLTLVFVSCVLMYHAVLMGFMAQTIGQLVWGVMVVRNDGEPVLMGRAFVFSVAYLLFFWSTLFFSFCLPSKRAIQDFMSGIRVVKTTTTA